MLNSLIASRVFNTVLMIHPDKLNAVSNYMQSRMMGVDIPEVSEKDRSAYTDSEMFIINSITGESFDSKIVSQDGDVGERPYNEQNMNIANAVALIGVQGVLVNRKGKMRGSSDEFTSYHRLRENLETARSRKIENVILDVDSPGGEAIGAHELAKFIYSLRSEMKITAVISGMCCSAAYYLASACSEVVISETSFGGHVGTRYRRWDFTAAIEKQDVTYEDFHYGDSKLEGDPTVKSTDKEREKIKGEIEFHGNLFSSDVAKYRGMTQQAVIDTQANTYYGQEAVKIGFADRVMDAHDAVANIYQTINQKEDRYMSNQTDQVENPQAEHQDEVVSLDVAEVQLEARQDERTRIGAIITSEHAVGRTALAQHLAFKTDQTSEEAVATLEVSPIEASNESGSVIDSLMSNEDQPEITNGDGDGAESGMSEGSKYRSAWAKKNLDNGGDK